MLRKENKSLGNHALIRVTKELFIVLIEFSSSGIHNNNEFKQQSDIC
jgi:hypothetical protein